MINILHIIGSLPFGGAENLLLTLARNTDRTQFNLIFCCLNSEGFIADSLRDEGFKVTCLGSYRFRYFYKKMLDIARLIKTEKIDIVYTHLIEANHWGRIGAFIARAPIVCKSEHAILPELWIKPSFKQRIYRFTDRVLDYFTDMIVYVSEYQRNVLTNGKHDVSKHLIVSNAVDQKRFTLSMSKSDLKNRYGFDGSNIIIGTVGRLVRDKGHEYLFKALKQVNDAKIATQLLIIGDGPEENRLKNLAHELGINVLFLSMRHDIPELMKCMDIYTQPTLRESFGIAIAEAMYSGLPVIASNVCGIPEIIQNGITGILVDQKNPTAIADAILDIVKNPAKADELARRGRESIVAKYTGSIYAEKVGRLYETAMARKCTMIQKRSKCIAYILGSFPGGNPPFIINEVKALQSKGVDIIVCPIHRRSLSGRDANADGIKAIYADPIFSHTIIAAHFYYLFRKPGTYFKLLLNNKMFGGKKIFWEGVYYAMTIKKMGIRHVHAHFAWNATDCARIINKLTNIPFSFTAHQSDIHRYPERLGDKLEEAKFILTCTKGNKEYLAAKYGDNIGSKTHAVYHGIEMSKFIPEENANKSIDILSIGGLIKCKGFEYLIKACGLLMIKNSYLCKKCVIVGNGEEKGSLISLIRDLDLENNVEILDPVSYEEVAKLYRKAKIFVLPVTIIDGAPHGIPNVLAEAMAVGLPVIATNVPHIPELIENNINGLLIADKDPRGLADAIEELLSSEGLRSRLGEEARKKIINDFDSKKHAQTMVDLFTQATQGQR